jgi:threonine dehydrogenase-like Zn-dependent dehydrogenase
VEKFYVSFVPNRQKLLGLMMAYGIRYAEYAKAPLENCYPLDEKRLLGSPADGGLGYRVSEISYAFRQLVPFGGLVDIDLKPGETIIIAPATGAFGGAAVEVALAMGARVIAAARNTDSLKRLAATNERILTVQLTGDVETDGKALKQFGPVDAFQDWCPPVAAKTTHIKACMLALRVGGRVSLMGGIREDISISYTWVMHNNLTIKGKWMYTQEDPYLLIKMIESGILKLGERAGLKNAAVFPLEDWSKAFTAAEENPGWGSQTLIAP